MTQDTLLDILILGLLVLRLLPAVPREARFLSNEQRHRLDDASAGSQDHIAFI